MTKFIINKLSIVFLAIFLFPNTSDARDIYLEKAVPEWNVIFKINPRTTVKSKIKLSNYSKSSIKSSYFISIEKFIERFGDYFPNRLLESNLEIRIISEKDLSNREFFPGEDEYSSLDGKYIVVGRFFKNYKNMSGIIYIVPPNNYRYWWDYNFAHEIAHFLFFIKNMRFRSVEREHETIKEFLLAYPVSFPHGD